MSLSRNFPIVGISLIEVLVALVIFSVGALGLMGLQQKAIQATEAAHWHHKAMSIARDVIERMRANPLASATYKKSEYWQAQKSKSCNNWDNPCSANELAQADMADIYLQAERELPTPHIQVVPCAGVTCVAVSWLNSETQCNITDPLARAHCVVMTFWQGS